MKRQTSSPEKKNKRSKIISNININYDEFIISSETEPDIEKHKQFNSDFFTMMKRQKKTVNNSNYQITMMKNNKSKFHNYLILIHETWKLLMLNLYVVSNLLPDGKGIMNNVKELQTKYETDFPVFTLSDNSDYSNSGDNNVRYSAEFYISEIKKIILNLYDLLKTEKLNWDNIKELLTNQNLISFIKNDTQKLQQIYNSLKDKSGLVHITEQLISRNSQILPPSAQDIENIEFLKDKLEREQRKYHRTQLLLHRPKTEDDNPVNTKPEEVKTTTADPEQISKLKSEIDELTQLAEQWHNNVLECQTEKTNLLVTLKQKEILKAMDSVPVEKIKEYPNLQELESKAQITENDTKSIHAEFEESLRNLQEAQSKKRFDNENRAATFSALAKTKEDQIIAVETKFKKLTWERDNLLYQIEKTKQEVAKPEVMQVLNTHVYFLKNQVNAELNQQERLFEIECRLKERVAQLQNSSSSNLLQESVSNWEQKCNQLSTELDTKKIELEASRTKERKLLLREQELRYLIELYQKNSYKDLPDRLTLIQNEANARREYEELEQKYYEIQQKNEKIPITVETKSYEQKFREIESDIECHRKKLSSLMELLNQQQTENATLLSESRSIEKTYDAKGTEITRTEKLLSYHCQITNGLLNEKFKLSQALANLQKKNEAAPEKTNRNHTDQESSLRSSVEQIKTFEEQIRQANVNIRDATLRSESNYSTARQKHIQTCELKHQLDQTQKELDKLLNLGQDTLILIDKEKSHSQSLQEEISSLKKRIRIITKNGGYDPTIDEKLKDYKAALRCSVCHDNVKDCVITRCYHVFCRPCISANLANRHRKCPGCGKAFGEGDVHTVFFVQAQ